MSGGIDIRKAEAALRRAAHKAIHGTSEERSGRVISSALAEVRYSAQSGDLDIRFVNGKTYRYFNVPLDVYESLVAAPSKGTFFNGHIKDRYDYRQL